MMRWSLLFSLGYWRAFAAVIVPLLMAICTCTMPHWVLTASPVNVPEFRVLEPLELEPLELELADGVMVVPAVEPEVGVVVSSVVGELAAVAFVLVR